MIPIIARKSFLIVLNNLIGGILGFVSLLFITWYMGAEDLGVLAFGLSFFGIFSFISNMGFDSAHNKRISEGLELSSCMGTYIMLKLILIGIMTAVSLVSLFIYGYLLGKFSSELEMKVSIIFLGYYVLWSLTQIAVTTFNALRKQAMAQIPNIFEHVVRSTLIVLVAISGIHYGILYVALAYVVGMGTMLLLTVYFLKEFPVTKPDKILMRSYTQFAIPMAVISFIGALSNYLDKVMIDFFRDSTEVGLFFGVQRIIQFLTMSSMALGILLFPTISSYHSKGKLKEINGLVSRAERYLSFLIFPVVTLLVVFSFSIVRLLGDDFHDAGWILTYLALFAFMSALCRPFNQVLTATGRLQRAIFISITVLGLNITLNLILIPDTEYVPDSIAGVTLVSGAAGAAVATFVADCVRFVLVRWESGKIVGYRMDGRFMGTNLVASLVMGGALYYLHVTVTSIEEWYFLFPKLVLGLVFYLVLMVLFKGFTKEDFHFFMDLIHPGKMKNYISDELKNKGNGQ